MFLLGGGSLSSLEELVVEVIEKRLEIVTKRMRENNEGMKKMILQDTYFTFECRV